MRLGFYMLLLLIFVFHWLKSEDGNRGSAETLEEIGESCSQNKNQYVKEQNKEEVRKDVGRIKRGKMEGTEIKERWEERKEEEEMRGKLEGRGKPQQGLHQAVAEETRTHAVDPPPASPPAL